MASNPNKRKRSTPQSQSQSKSKSQPSLAIKKNLLLESRKQLPIWSRRQDIQDALQNGKKVLILSGETGSGKSTQVPQFLLDSCSGMIAVTQPRRVAATSLARRVAEEMGSPLGSSSPASTVGYSVRFDENTSPSTRIKFLTEGMLLQEMLRDPLLSRYSCVIVDEVHERSVNVDLLIGFLKELLDNSDRKSQLKVVVMSATADVQSLVQFFSQEPNPASVSCCQVKGRQYPVKTHYLDQPTNDVFDAALIRIFSIHCKEPMPGDILVFQTGQEAIERLQKLVEDLAQNLTKDFPKILVLPLFASLPQAAQHRVFERAPPNTRKLILSTNMAETSVTVPGVRFVVDMGKAKIKRFRPNGVHSLLIRPISKSSADQRKGRAGREAPGQCFRLYTEASYNELEIGTKPEILRCDLSSAFLVMTARGVKDVVSFPYLTFPNHTSIVKAMNKLCWLGAVDSNSKITATGREVARLPLTPALGRVIYEAAKPHRDCLHEVIDIVACLSVEESIFLNTEGKEVREKAETARSQLYRRQGDHLTLLAAVRAYTAEQTDRRRWADDHLISHRAMKKVMDARKQLINQCKQKLQDRPTPRETVEETTQESILKCFLTGFADNTAGLCQDRSYKTLVGNQTVAIHPSSFLFGKKVEMILYTEFLFTGKAYAKGVSAIQKEWIHEYAAEQTYDDEG